MAAAATAGSAIHRGSTAERPGNPSVTSQLPSASLPCASTRGTGTRPCAHTIRSASPGRSISGVPVATHFAYRTRPFPSSRRNVSPPSSFSHTGTSRSPPASSVTTAGTATGPAGLLARAGRLTPR
jgi:hypothetical protein